MSRNLVAESPLPQPHLDQSQMNIMNLYIAEVCNLIDQLNTDKSRKCLKPVCELGIREVFEYDKWLDEEHFVMPTALPTTFPTFMPTLEEEKTEEKTDLPVPSPTAGPSMVPTKKLA